MSCIHSLDPLEEEHLAPLASKFLTTTKTVNSFFTVTDSKRGSTLLMKWAESSHVVIMLIASVQWHKLTHDC